MTATIVPRSEWGAAPPKRPLTDAPCSLGLTFHWEGTPLGAYPASAEPTMVRNIQRVHQAGEYTDIAYNFVIGRSGAIFEGRGWDKRSGANGTTAGNDAAFAVCYLGGPGDPLTPAARAAYIALRDTHLARGGGADTWPHSYWVATQCPGPELTALAAELDGSGPSSTQPNPPTPTGSDDQMAWQAKDPNGTVWVVAPPFKMELSDDGLRQDYVARGWLHPEVSDVHPWTLANLVDVTAVGFSTGVPELLVKVDDLARQVAELTARLAS